MLDTLLNEYLFMGFLKIFHKFFDIPVINSTRQHERFTISDHTYQIFLRDVLQLLEPMRALKNELLYEELDDVQEIIFLSDSDIKIGYSMNNKRIFRISQTANAVGVFGVTFNRKSHYIYKVIQDSDGYFIRQSKWLKLLNSLDNKILKQSIEDKITTEYEDRIEAILEALKHKDL